MSGPGQSEFIAICQRLHDAQLAAVTPEEREAADADFSHFLRMNAAGRLQEWIDGHLERMQIDKMKADAS